MAKFKMRFKLTGLEIELEGERADIPQLAAGISQQLSSVVRPTLDIAANGRTPMLEQAVDKQTGTNNAGGKGRGSKSRKPANNGDASQGGQPVTALDFSHQPNVWGNPPQSWTAIQKMIWLLYVYEQATGSKELAVTVIAPTFKKHFKQSGVIHPPLVTRELGKAKSASPALVGEDATKSPASWYLTDTGKAVAVQLITEARGGESSRPGN